MGLDIYFNRTSSKEIGYFRKVNFLVSFFSEVCQQEIENLTPVQISKEDCVKLLDRCNKVLESKTEEVSSSLLPVCSGFFFGNDKYNEHYYEDVEDVKNYVEHSLLPEFEDIEPGERIEFEIWY